MLSKTAVAFATVFLAIATTAAAGVFEIEVPADLKREDLLDPTPAVKARLEALMREKIAKHPAEANCAPVAFTKNGELIYPEVVREAMDDWSDNRLTFIPADTAENRFLWPEFEGSWEAAAPFGRGGPLAVASAEPLSCSPNPVRCAATITFKVEAPCRVNLAIYDISGRRVATLAEGPYAAGEHSASWQADVPAGVYIYRLRAGDDVAVKKLVVAR